MRVRLIITQQYHTSHDTDFYSHYDFKCLLTNKLLRGLIAGIFYYVEQIQMRQPQKSQKGLCSDIHLSDRTRRN